MLRHRALKQDADGVMSDKTVTIHTVAKEAGVSVATVSRVIRDHPDVSEKTRAKVQEVIKRLKYRPSAVARALVSNRSNTLGLMVADIDNPYFSQLAKSVEAAAYAVGIRTILCNTADDPDRELSYLDELLAHRVDGLIQASHYTDSPLIDTAMENEVNVVAVNRPVFGHQIDSVVLDNLAGAQMATQHLIDLGHTRIAHIEGPTYATNVPERRAGYDQALKKNALEIDDELIYLGSWNRSTPIAAVEEFMNLDNPPTAIFAADDMFAMVAYGAYLEKGLKVPDDVSIVGFDGTAIANLGMLNLTTISQDIDYVGTRAVEILVERKATGSIQAAGDTPVITEVLTPKLTVRRSTGPPPTT